MKWMAHWWATRDTREHWMLGTMFLMLFAFVYWYALLTPLRAWRNDARQAYARAAGDVTVIRHQLALREAVDRPMNPAIDAEAVLASARGAGLAASRRRNGDPRVLVIGIDSTQATPFFRWLEQLRDRQHLAPTRLRIEKADGALQVELAFETPATDETSPVPVPAT